MYSIQFPRSRQSKSDCTTSVLLPGRDYKHQTFKNTPSFLIRITKFVVGFSFCRFPSCAREFITHTHTKKKGLWEKVLLLFFLGHAHKTLTVVNAIDFFFFFLVQICNTNFHKTNFLHYHQNVKMSKFDLCVQKCKYTFWCTGVDSEWKNMSRKKKI